MSFLSSITNGLRQGYKLYTGCVKPAKKAASKPYKLLEKTEGKIAEFPSDSWAVPESADSFTRVKIGKKTDPEYSKEIVTFYNGDKGIIMRCKKGTGIPNTIRTYEHDFGLSKNEDGIFTRQVNEKQYLLVDEEADYRAWVPVSEETQCTHKLWDKKKGFDVPVKYTSVKKEHNLQNQSESTVTITEYPTTCGVEPKSAKREMKVGLKEDYVDGVYVPSVMEVSASDNVTLPKDDEFLPYRFVKGSQKQESLAKHFLKKKGLEGMHVTVGTSGVMVSDDAAACFFPKEGHIYFKKPDTYAQANVSAHEVEHAWQHSLVGRSGAGKTQYEKNCKEILGPLTNPEEIAEAEKFAQASDNYSGQIKLEDGSINPKYWNNYLEVKAREAGEAAQKKYDEGEDVLLEQFKYIPKRTL